MKENRERSPEGILYTSLGLGIYVVVSLTNRFLFQIPGPIYMILLLAAIFFIIKGFRDRSRARSQ